MPTVLHLDMDAFFAAVEVLDNPSLGGKPIIVGGPRHSPRGVVSTCSYEARKFGVHSGMPISRAVRLCPGGVFLQPRHQRYAEVSEKLFHALTEFAPAIEPLSIDEAFLEMTGCEHFYSDLHHMGREVKEAVFRATGLTASVGIAPNKFLAKLASDWEKPNGLMILMKQIPERLAPLPVGKIWGVGKKGAELLQSVGYQRIGDLQQAGEERLIQLLGHRGQELYRLSMGIDQRKVDPGGPVKSMGREITFDEDKRGRAEIESILALLSQDVGERLRRAGLACRIVMVKYRTPDFQTWTRQETLTEWVQTDEDLYAVGRRLLRKHWDGRALRLVGLYASDFEECKQLSLFSSEQRQKQEKLAHIVDEINTKAGGRVIERGLTFSSHHLPDKSGSRGE